MGKSQKVRRKTITVDNPSDANNESKCKKSKICCLV